jgi:hypothetical protein
MRKIIVFMGMILFFGVSFCLAQEEIAITTYYPSPYGVYDELLTNKLAIGDTDSSGQLDSGDIPATANDGDLFVAGNVGIGTTNPPTRLAVTGLTSGGGNVLRIVPGTGAIYYEASSERYKEDIRDFKDNFYKVLKAKPKSFAYKTTGERDIGYIAEDFDKLGLDDLLIYRDGRPDAVKYDRLPLYILEIVKNQQCQLEDLRQKNIELEGKIKTLEERLRL